MTNAAATSITRNADPTDAPTMTAVASKLLCTAASTGVHAAADTLPAEDVVWRSGQGTHDVDALDVEYDPMGHVRHVSSSKPVSEYAPGRHAEVETHRSLDHAPAVALPCDVAQPKGQREHEVPPVTLEYLQERASLEGKSGLDVRGVGVPVAGADGAGRHAGG